MTLRIACAAEPGLNVSPAEALVARQWIDGALELSLAYSHGVVELSVEQ
jgi:hypothetical protein